jgi:glycerophosphoryl diester phosphodiesterase
MPELVAMGVRTIAPPIWVLVTVADGRIAPSAYARAAKAAGLDIVTWTLERPGTVSGIGGFYFHTIATEVDNEGDVYTVLDVLAREVGVVGVFSDWPATVTYYANCIGL